MTTKKLIKEICSGIAVREKKALFLIKPIENQCAC